MSDLAEYNTNMSVVTELIEAYNKKVGDSEKPRSYLGASIIGTECARALWYDFRHCVKREFSGRMYRLFDTGRLEEPRFVGELRAIGLEVVDGEAPGQQIAIEAVYGHFRGHLDGACKGVPEGPETWHVLEFKTHSRKSFEDLKKKGVKLAKPTHHAQMMVYMGRAGMTRALYLAKNKDTDEIYAERIRYDAAEFNAIMARAEDIIFSIKPPERIAARADDFRCRFCDAKALCWGQSATKAVPVPFKGCRTCCHATPTKDGDGAWRCEFHKCALTFDKQLAGCNKHLFIPDLIHFASPCDAGTDWIEYQNDDGVHWRQGEGGFLSEQLLGGRGPMDAQENVPFEANETDIFDRYPPEDSRLLWEGSCDKDEIEKAVIRIVGEGYGFAVTDKGNDDQRGWEEYEGKWLLVWYSEQNYAAIFEGVE